MPTATEELSRINEIFVARKEVMFQAIHDYHAESHAGQNNDQKLELLIGNVNKAAASNDRISPEDAAKIALEWEQSIRSHPAADTLGFVNDVKDVTTGAMPALPKGYDYGSDLRKVEIDNAEKLKVAQKIMFDNLQGKPAPSMPDMQDLASKSAAFQKAGENNHLIEYSQGGNLTKQFDALDVSLTPQQVESKRLQLQTLSTELQTEKKTTVKTTPQQETNASAPEEDGLSWLKNMGGIGEFIAGIIAALGSMFASMGGKHEPSAAEIQAQKDLGQKYNDTTKENLSKLVDKSGKYSEALVDTNHDGKIDMKEINKVMAGQNSDVNKDGKVDDEMLSNLDRVAKNHPEIQDIAASFRKTMEGLNADGHTNAALPGAGKAAAAER